MCVCVCTYTLDCVGTGGPAHHWDSWVGVVGVQLKCDLVCGQTEGGDHLTEAAGEGTPTEM